MMDLSSYYHGLATDRLILRKLTPEDQLVWEAFYVNNPQLPYLGIDLNRTIPEMAQAWVGDQLARYQAQAFGQLALEHQETGALVGTAGFKWNEVPYQGTSPLTMAMALLPAYWRQGYGKETVRALLSVNFKYQWCPEVFFFANEANHTSIQLLQKAFGLTIRDTLFMGDRMTTVLSISAVQWKQPSLDPSPVLAVTP